MAAAEGGAPVGAPVRVRRTGSSAWPEAFALAKALESDVNIRLRFRENKNQLLAWTSPELVGTATMKALAMNVNVVLHALEVWCKSCSTPKCMVIDWLKQEVTEAHKMLNPAVSKGAVSIYVDAWGIKRLSSLALRRWRAPIARLRDAQCALNMALKPSKLESSIPYICRLRTNPSTCCSMS
ncbi:unnamed protein product [Symbiodinium necroappetens]|uniref:Uncharacterized protein n=1 Tax=Symbiodinium necroappetens TaxID=1628268 RepID=A0A813C4U6_9DINO|nr:unnamed protein product [Symbiodinium necroappetens]